MAHRNANMQKFTDNILRNGNGDEKFYDAKFTKAKKKGIHKIGKFKKAFETGDVMFQEKSKDLSTDYDSGKFYVTKSKTHYTKPAPGVKTPFIEKTIKEKRKLVSEKKAGKIDARIYKKNIKKFEKKQKEKRNK